MKKNKVFFSILKTIVIYLIFVLIFFNAGIVSAAEKKIELSYLPVYNDKHPTMINAHFPWMEEIKNKTNGRVVIQYNPPDTIVPQPETYDAIVAGAGDLGFTPVGFDPGKFPVAESITLPMLFPSSTVGSLVAWDLYNKYEVWRAEFQQVKVLTHWVSALIQVHTTKKPIRVPKDFEGLKIICLSPNTFEMVKLLGGNPIRIKPVEMYMALERGIADGLALPLAPVRSMKLDEPLTYTTNAKLGVDVFTMIMNKDRWESLPPDIQKVFNETTGKKLSLSSGRSLDEGAAADEPLLKKKGHTFIYLTPDETQMWREALQPMYDNYFKKMESEGHDNMQLIVKDATELTRKYSKEFGN